MKEEDIAKYRKDHQSPSTKWTNQHITVIVTIINPIRYGLFCHCSALICIVVARSSKCRGRKKIVRLFIMDWMGNGELGVGSLPWNKKYMYVKSEKYVSRTIICRALKMGKCVAARVQCNSYIFSFEYFVHMNDSFVSYFLFTILFWLPFSLYFISVIHL